MNDDELMMNKQKAKHKYLNYAIWKPPKKNFQNIRSTHSDLFLDEKEWRMTHLNWISPTWNLMETTSNASSSSSSSSCAMVTSNSATTTTENSEAVNGAKETDPNNNNQLCRKSNVFQQIRVNSNILKRQLTKYDLRK